MKNIMLTTLIFICSISFVSAQGRYVKRVENNYIGNIERVFDEHNVVIRTEGDYNTSNKKGIGKLFFGDLNAKIEYLLEPSIEATSGLRIVDSMKIYTLEIKTITNFKEVNLALDREFDSLSRVNIETENFIEATEHNKVIWDSKREERVKHYKINTKSIPISASLVDRLYAKTVVTIDTYEPVVNIVSSNNPFRDAKISYDGYTTTLRSVVGDDMWTLSIQPPIGEAEKLSDIFRQIILDVENNCFDEAKYIKMLNN